MTQTQPSPLYVARGGNGGRLLVFLHGLGANSSVWSRMLPAIDKFWEGRWIAPDFRGHGRSQFIGPYGFGSHAADIAALIADEPPATVCVVGHSFGGAIGALLGTGWFGPHVGRLFAFGVKLSWTANDIAKSHEMAGKPARTFATRDEAVDRYLKVSGLYGLIDVRDAEAGNGVFEVSGGYQVRFDPRAYGAVGPAIPEIFSLVKIPFRLAAGALDSMVSAADMRAIDKNAVVLRESGHNVHYEQPGMLWEAIAGELKATS